MSIGGGNHKEIQYEDLVKNIVERKSLKSQSLHTPKSHYHTIEIIPQIIIQKIQKLTHNLLESDSDRSL